MAYSSPAAPAGIPGINIVGVIAPGPGSNPAVAVGFSLSGVVQPPTLTGAQATNPAPNNVPSAPVQ